MKARELAVHGAVEFTAPAFADDRGSFATPLDAGHFRTAAGRELFGVVQACVSRSRRDVFRGVHYSAVPPGRAKYVWCAHGRCRDWVIDLRLGSPTFGRHEVLELSGDQPRGLYFPAGVGHAFLALEDDTVMSYLLAGGYVPEQEHALDPFDSELGLDLPDPAGLVLSDRDLAAPSLAEAARRGLLPRYDQATALPYEPASPTKGNHDDRPTTGGAGNRQSP